MSFYLFYAMLLTWFGIEQGIAEQGIIYITPNSTKTSCPTHSKPCLTLSEFASSLNGKQAFVQPVKLLILPGEHTLDSESGVFVKNVSKFSMQSLSRSKLSQITCQINKTRFHFELISSVHIYGLKFVGCGNNTAELVDNLTVQHTTFVGTNGSGTALILNETNAEIVNTTFESNVVGTLKFWYSHRLRGTFPYFVGGAIFASHSNVKILDSIFVRNHARNFGGAICTQFESNLTLINTTFTENSVCVDSSLLCFGGAISHEVNFRAQFRSKVLIIKSIFSRNRGYKGASVVTVNTDVGIKFSSFNSNYSPLIIIKELGEILDIKGNSHLSIDECTFNNNTAGSVIRVAKSVTLTQSQFENNKGLGGSVLSSTNGTLIIKRCHFKNNSAYQGGVLFVRQCNVTIDECEFNENYVSANVHFTVPVNHDPTTGGVLNSLNSHLTINGTNFTSNRAEKGLGGVLLLVNKASLVVVSCSFVNNQAQDGGVIHVSQSTAIFRGTSYMMRNSATNRGGAIYASENSVLNVYSELVISNNSALSGGGAYLYQSTLGCEQSCDLRYEYNVAVYSGGAIYVLNSIISILVYRISTTNPHLLIVENHAQYGGGMCFLLSSTLQIIKTGYLFIKPQRSVYFIANSADYGAAIYVVDQTKFDTCLFNTECFLQVLSNDNTYNHINSSGMYNIVFIGNSAKILGSVLYGGLLDRCILGDKAEITINGRPVVDGVTFFRTVSILSGNKGILIASQPVRICLCNADGKLDCESSPKSIAVKKGENFSIPVVAVDQVSQTYTNTPIFAQLNYSKSGLGVGQLVQIPRETCSNLHFNIYSPYPTDVLNLYADGPCRNTNNSTLQIKIVFEECICPVGFQPRELETDNNCVCECDPQLLPKYITSCDSHTHTLTRRGNSWISYLNITNDTNQYSYLTYPYCPLDYCLSPDTNVEINLNVQDGSDVQCQNNRSGLLCGLCQPGLTVSLGTSRCILCDGGHDLWWLILIFITAGVALVAVLLVLNITVAVGTINGLVFYANIIGATSSAFLSTSSTKPAYIIVSWLNLELGFDACFVDGLDTYMKTWILMAFPTYIIFLLIIMIVWSERSLRFARLIGRKNPVALLATLILLSYAKFLLLIITALLFITLQYPDDSYEVVWLPDASVDYLSVKHLVLVVVAIVILLVGSVYTILLLFWQWIRKWAVGRISHKVCLFFDIYQAPYKLKYRFWPGLLLLARVTLYLLFALNQSGDPKVNLIGIIIVMCSLLLLKGACGRVYTNKAIDFLEVASYINISAFSAVQLYSLQSGKPHTITAFFSVSITAALLVIVVSYHIFTAIFLKLWKECKSMVAHCCRHSRMTQNNAIPTVNEVRPLNDSIDLPVVTTSVVEFPGTEFHDKHSEDDKDLDAVHIESDGNTCDDNINYSKPLLHDLAD